MRSLKTVLLCLPLVFGLSAAFGAAFGAEDGKPAPVEVRLSEYVIEMPHTLPPGPTTFLVHNDGSKSHSFKIQGPGIDSTLEAIVRPHASGSLQVTLQPGDYTVYCPIGSHSAKGMTMKLAVKKVAG
jgi:plastocyanin